MGDTQNKISLVKEYLKIVAPKVLLKKKVDGFKDLNTPEDLVQIEGAIKIAEIQVTKAKEVVIERKEQYKAVRPVIVAYLAAHIIELGRREYEVDINKLDGLLSLTLTQYGLEYRRLSSIKYQSKSLEGAKVL